MVYDLVVLDPNEDDMKKCSTKLLDGVLALLGKSLVYLTFIFPKFIFFVSSIHIRCPDGVPTDGHR